MFNNLINKFGIALDRRISRSQFQRNLGLVFILIWILVIDGIMLYVKNINQASPIWFLLCVLFVCAFGLLAISNFLGGIGRLHDMNKSGSWLLLQSIPVVGFIQTMFFLFKKGNAGENQFGPIPKDRTVPLDTTVRIFGVMSYFVAVILLSALA